MSIEEEVRRDGYNWHHEPSGARAWIVDKYTPLVGKGKKPIRQPEVHVYVPEEHRRKGIGSALIKKILKDLAEENLHLPKDKRFYRVYVQLTPHLATMGSKKVFDTDEFKGDEFFKYHKIDNYDD
ncbi:MAG: GNAT family N-acetyltransferase [Candidatus Diapherotrites archaeon]|nr:GNAT family N-acetyltransferase [Candidatus Diapherotrites archaeon]